MRKAVGHGFGPKAMFNYPFNPKRIARQIRFRIDSENRGTHLETMSSNDVLPDY